MKRSRISAGLERAGCRQRLEQVGAGTIERDRAHQQRVDLLAGFRAQRLAGGEPREAGELRIAVGRAFVAQLPLRVLLVEGLPVGAAAQRQQPVAPQEVGRQACPDGAQERRAPARRRRRSALPAASRRAGCAAASIRRSRRGGGRAGSAGSPGRSARDRWRASPCVRRRRLRRRAWPKGAAARLGGGRLGAGCEPLPPALGQCRSRRPRRIGAGASRGAAGDAARGRLGGRLGRRIGRQVRQRRPLAAGRLRRCGPVRNRAFRLGVEVRGRGGDEPGNECEQGGCRNAPRSRPLPAAGSPGRLKPRMSIWMKRRIEDTTRPVAQADACAQGADWWRNPQRLRPGHQRRGPGAAAGAAGRGARGLLADPGRAGPAPAGRRLARRRQDARAAGDGRAQRWFVLLRLA